MHRFRWVALSCLLVTIPFPGCTALPFREELASHETAEFNGISKVYVETKNGSIDVQCVEDAEQADIHVTRFASGLTPEDARKRAEEIRIDVQRDTARPEVLRIVAKFPAVNTGNRGANFQVTLPQTVSAELLTSNGRLSVAGAVGDVHAETSNGRITVNGIKGAIYAKTSNGAVFAREIDGSVDARTSNGEIDMEQVGPAGIKAETSNGRIRVVEACGNAAVHSSNGRVELRLLLVPDKPTIKAVTSNGDVVVELPHTVSARLDMHTTNGRVSADLTDVGVKDFRSGRRNLTATLHDGAGTVYLQSSNGSVTLETSPRNP